MKRIVLPVMVLIGTLVGGGLLVGAGRAVDYRADFSKALDKGWSFVREDKADWRLKDGKLQLLAQPSNIWGKKNNKTENFLLRALPGPKAAVEVTVDFNPRKEYEQAGLMIYLDDDNYIKFDRELYGGQSCTLVLESKAKPKGRAAGQLMLNELNAGLDDLENLVGRGHRTKAAGAAQNQRVARAAMPATPMFKA